MNPDQIRKEQLELATQILEEGEVFRALGNYHPYRDKAEKLARLVIQLDNDLCEGGELPEDWRAKTLEHDDEQVAHHAAR